MSATLRSHKASFLTSPPQIHEDLDSGYTAGAVVTHGTDTLRQTALFLDSTIKSDRPVVMVGVMRPAIAISADGPMNLLTAVAPAVSDSVKGCGVMVVLND
jgi:L-asparaginase